MLSWVSNCLLLFLPFPLFSFGLVWSCQRRLKRTKWLWELLAYTYIPPFFFSFLLFLSLFLAFVEREKKKKKKFTLGGWLVGTVG
ncbi:hypothetical protein B0T19DRAFT_417292, partial [Cercophora scortea]